MQPTPNPVDEEQTVNALFAFDDPGAARTAAHRLVEQGLAAKAIAIHVNDAIASSSTRRLDEQISGGLVSNLFDLFQGVLEWGDSPHDTSPFETTIRKGGAVVSVDACARQRGRVDTTMDQAGCGRRTDWS